MSKKQFAFFKTAAMFAPALALLLTTLNPSSGADQPQKTGSNRSASQESTPSEQTQNKTQPRQSGTSEQIKSITAIKAVVIPEGEEKVLFYLNGFYPPKVIVLEDEKPRVVCDFYDTDLNPEIKYPIKVNNNLIQKIRIGIYRHKTAKIRVVLDLNPIYDYDVEQTFFMNESIYAIILKKL